MKESILITIKNKFGNVVLSISSSEKNLFEKITTNKKDKHFMIKENDKEKKQKQKVFSNMKLKLF